MATKSKVVQVTYIDPKTGERIRETRIQPILDENNDNAGGKELVPYEKDRPSPQEQQLVRRSNNDDDEYYFRQTRRRERLGDDQEMIPYGRDIRGPRRRNDSQSDNDSLDRDRRRRRRGSRRARSEDDGDGKLWYSMKDRKDGNLLERSFDPSYDGILAAAAGGAIGAMTARRFGGNPREEVMPGGEKKRNWRTVGGAVVGAAAFNVAENYFRVYTEEKEEGKTSGRRGSK